MAIDWSKPMVHWLGMGCSVRVEEDGQACPGVRISIHNSDGEVASESLTANESLELAASLLLRGKMPHGGELKLSLTRDGGWVVRYEAVEPMR